MVCPYGWSIPTFKLIGDSFGNFIQVDEKTLREESFVRGRILISTEKIHKIMGTIELVILEKRYNVRVEEDESFRFVKSSIAQGPLLSSIQKEGDADDVDTEISRINDMRDELQYDVADRSENNHEENLLEPNKVVHQLTEYGEMQKQPADQQSQIPKVAHLIDLEVDEVNNEAHFSSNLSHGLESLAETGEFNRNIGYRDCKWYH